MGLAASDWNKVGGVMSYQVTGLNDTLRALKLFEPELYAKLRKDLVTDATPLANEVGSKFPNKPLKWWKESGRAGNARMPGYNATRAQTKVKPIAGTGREHSKGRVILRLQQMDGGGQVFDTAGGMRAKSQFVQNLDKHSRVKSRGGRFRSRILFPFTKKISLLCRRLSALWLKS
jgi:hypothetical protein